MNPEKITLFAFAFIFVLSTCVITAYENGGYSATEPMNQLNPGSTTVQSQTHTAKRATKHNQKYQNDDGDSDSYEYDTEEDDSVYYDEDDYSSEEENNELPGAPEGAGENEQGNPSTPSTSDVPATVSSP